MSSQIDMCRNNARQRWNVVRQLLHTANRSTGSVSANNSDMCNTFAVYFNSKIVKLKSDITAKLLSYSPVQFADPPCTQSHLFGLSTVSAAEVAKLISSIPAKSSPLDYVPTDIIKSCSSVFSEIIAHLANLSFSQGSFPLKFKHASVTPLLKKPNLDPDLPSNYRPISNLNNISKLLERLFFSRLLLHISGSLNFNPQQSAYRQFHSTETSLLHLLDSIYHAADNGLATLLLALDLSAAFDTIDHSILLNRLHTSFGISGLAQAWLSSYLVNRSFSVRLDSFTSSAFPINCGVPQGSVLGPILFSLYTSPIASIVAGYSVNQQQYADDTQLFVFLSPSTLDTNLAQLYACLSSIRGWFLQNGLALNPDKTEAICLGTVGRRKSLSQLTSVHVTDSLVDLSDHTKLLGVILDCGLNFDAHTSNVCSSSYFHIRALRRIRPYIDLETSKTIASSIIGSRLDYANSALYGMPLRNIQRLQRVQNSLARVITANQSANSQSLLASLHWLPIQHRISFKIGTLVYRSLHGAAPQYLNSLLSPYTPSRQLRSSSQHLLSVPRLNTALGSRGFRASGPSLWNSLPDNIRSIDSYSSFKSHLKAHLFRK